MVVHKGKRLCITGIPASGKSYLAEKLAHAVGGVFVKLDDLREKNADHPLYKQWINFYYDKDEASYYTHTPPYQLWQDMIDQSEGLWPLFVEHIETYSHETRPVIFECVNLLPHLVARDLGFSEIVLLGSSYEEILERNKKDPRWGNTDFLQELEAKNFFFVERPGYKNEGEQFGSFVCDGFEEAYTYGLSILSQK